MKNKYIIAISIAILASLLFLTSRVLIEQFETNQSNKTIHVYNRFHLGDNVFNLRLFNHIANELKTKNIKIRYALEQSQINNLRDWVYDSQVELIPLNERSSDSYELWMGTEEDRFVFDKMMTRLYNKFVSNFNLNTHISDMYFTDDALISRYNTLADKYKNCDILVINGECRSGQCYNEKNKQEWPEVCHYLQSKYKIVTTDKIEGIVCTRDNNLSLRDIAAISTSAKYIIGVHSGPIAGCYTTNAKQNQKWFIIANYPIKHEQINAVNITSPKEILIHL
jgi:hypothetical protein